VPAFVGRERVGHLAPVCPRLALPCVLLDEGHLWGKKEIAIPIGAVKDVAADGVRLKLTRDEVRDLPSVDLAHQ